MRVAILGTRGIPNRYGGFEQLAEYLSVGLAERGHEVMVYCPHNHPFQGDTWKGVQLIHQNDPEHRWGTAGQFIYDLNCIRDSRKRNLDVLLQLGYTSNSIWWFRLPKNCRIATNMDGMEWKRSKYSSMVRRFLKVAERLAVKSSHQLIADSPAIAKYLKDKYDRDSEFIAYGATGFDNPDETALQSLGLQPFGYDLAIARMEPENNLETVIRGHLESDSDHPLALIGDPEKTPHGRHLKQKYTGENIRFLGSIYDFDLLNQVRHFSRVYFHGHSVGGTNPSLLEAMASNALVCAHDNEFNRAVLGEDAPYFGSASDVARIIREAAENGRDSSIIRANRQVISERFSWPFIVDRYEAVLAALIQSSTSA